MREVIRLRRRLESASQLLSVVRTMKALAAVNIRQFEGAVASIRTYFETVELGFQVALANEPEMLRTGTAADPDPVGAIVFGSDQGMCGSFNERVASYAREALQIRGLEADQRSLVLVGGRIDPLFDDSSFDVFDRFALPSSIEGVPRFVRTLTGRIADWREERNIERLLLFYNQQDEGARYGPKAEELLPIDRAFLERIADRKWESRAEPMITLSVDTLFQTLVEEYIYVGLYAACVESLASENSARLASMQSAQRNISDLLEELRTDYRRIRQSAITSELLDIVGGYEALRGER